MLFLVNVIVLCVAKYIFFYYVVRKFKAHNDAFSTAADYTLCIHIPRVVQLQTEADIDSEIDYQINKFKRDEDKRIKFLKKSLIFDTKEHVQLIQEKLAVGRLLRIAHLKKDKKIDKLESQRAEIVERIKGIRAEYRRNPFSNFTRWCFVTFSTQEDTQTVYRRNGTRFRWIHKSPNFQRAPEPPDVFWENWGLNYGQRLKRRLVSLAVTLTIICLDFGLILGAKYAQVRADKLESKVATFFINQTISIMVTICNFIISAAIIRLAEYESHRTIGDFYTAIVWKSTYSAFINTALVVLIANRVAKEDPTWGLFEFNGLMGSMFIMMLNHIVTDVVLLIFAPGLFVRLAKLYFVRKAAKAQDPNYFQIWANESYEPLRMETYSYYMFVLKAVCLAFFYQAILPYGLLLAMVELTLKYWVLKYLLVSRFRKPIEHQLNFSMDMIELFEFVIFVLALGFVVFSIIFVGWDVMKRPLTLLVLIVAFVEWVAGLSLIDLVIGKGADWADNPQDSPPYENIEHAICYDYDLMNPLTVVDKLRGKLGRKGGMDIGSLGSVEQQDGNKDPAIPVPGTNYNELLGGDDFEQCLEAYAANQQNQRGGFRVFQQDLRAQEKLLAAFAGERQVSQGNLPGFPDGLNPYQLIENNAEAFRNWANEKEGLVASRKTSIAKLEEMLPIGAGTEAARPPSQIRKDHFFAELIQNYAQALQENTSPMTVKEGEGLPGMTDSIRNENQETTKPVNQTQDDIDIREVNPKEGAPKSPST